MPFVLKGVEEGAVFHFFQNFYRNAAGNVDTTQGQDFKGKVASFSAVDVGPQVDGCDANRASLAEAILGNFRSGVGVGVGESSVLYGWIEKFVDGTEAAAGKNQLKTDLRIATEHEAKQFDFLFGVGSEIGVAAFGGADLITRAIPNEKSFAQAGARSEQRARATDFWRARIQNREVGRIEIFDAVAPGAQIVQKNDVFDAEFRGKYGRINGPGKIGGAHAIVDDRTGDAETGGADFFLTEMRGGYSGKFLGDEIEGGEVLAAEALLENGSEPAGLFRKKREVAFGAADVTGQYHEIPQNTMKQKTQRCSARKICRTYLIDARGGIASGAPKLREIPRFARNDGRRNF